jgi:retron-type reverse transcriptase
MLVAMVEEAWEKKWIMAALMIDIKGAFPTINHTCLLYKIWLAQIDKNLVQWTKSFMADRQVESMVNKDPGLTIDTNTGLPQGSPVSPVLFLIYITNLASLVEAMVNSTVALLFIDNVT